MKTTIDLPPDLVQQMKLLAVHEGRTLKDVAAEPSAKGIDDLKEGEFPEIRVSRPPRPYPRG